MKNTSDKAIHQLSSGTSLLWGLRGVFTSGRDVTLTPESGVFEAQVVEESIEKPIAKQRVYGRRKPEWITSNKTYQIGGQLEDVYVKHIGLRLAIVG